MTFLSSLRGQLIIMAGVTLDLEQELVPALIGPGIAKKGTFNGVCYSLFSNEEKLKTALRTSLNEIRDLFDQARVRLQTACTQHFEDLQKELAGETFDFPQRLKSERKILHVCLYLNPFIKQFLKGLDLPYLNFLGEGLGEAWLSYLTYARLVQKAKNLELTTGCAVPFRVLSRMNAGKKLNAKETDEIDAWLKAIADAKSKDVATFRGNKKNPYVQVHSMHRFLSVLSDLLNWDVAALEIKFYKMGCALFYEPDPYWMKVRERVLADDSFWIEEKEYKIETCLVNPQNLPDRSMMFSIQNEPALTLVIDPNEAHCAIQLKMQERHHYGVMMPRLLGKNKAVSLIERTYHPLSSIVWTSDKTELQDQDIIQAHPIVELLVGLCLQPCTLFPLTPNRFVFNYDNEMRALELMRMQVGKKSFETLEDFVWQCALNTDGTINPPVFSYLMRAGGLVNLPQSKSYQELMVMALKDKKIEAAVSLKGIFTEEDQLEQRKIFFLRIQELKTTIIEEILSVYQVMDLKKLHESLVSAFEAIHLRDSPGRLLLPSFSEQCKLHVLTALQLRMRPNYLAPIRAALIDKISCSDLGNAEIQIEWQEEKKYQLYGIYNKNQQIEIYYHGKIGYKNKQRL